MNKKILIISSLLLALSVFSISCAKSVTAPDNMEKPIMITDFEQNVKNEYLALVGSIIIKDVNGDGQNFNLVLGTSQQDPDTQMYNFVVTGKAEGNGAAVSHNELLQKLKNSVNNVNNDPNLSKSSKIYLQLNDDWDSQPTSKNSPLFLRAKILPKPGYSIAENLKEMTFIFNPLDAAGWAGF